MSTIKKQNEHYLTKETLRTIIKFKDLTDEQAEAICEFSKAYVHISYNAYLEHKKKEAYESSAKRISKIRKD